MKKFVAVSAGMLRPKKGDEGYRKAHRYLNYGLLSLASMSAVRMPVYHGNFSSPEEFLVENGEIILSDVVLLSLPSFYALPWAKRFVSSLHSLNAGIEVHVGGRWVVDHNDLLLREELPFVTKFHHGLGEAAVWDVNLSGSLSANEAKSVALGLAQKFMSMSNYYYLKSFSYFEPHYDWQSFSDDVADLPDSKLAFFKNTSI